ncbi:MAG: SAF domain-containing protein [Pseudomonadota bacterium]
MLAARADEGAPLRVAMIGAGKFAAMFLAQARRTRGLHIVGVADLDVRRAHDALIATGWPPTQVDAKDVARAVRAGTTFVTDNAFNLIEDPAIEIVVDATGSPQAAIGHALACLENGKHLVNVTVEADVLAGPLLAERFRRAGLVYSLAYGDQPALIAEMVDWARATGFDVICAGKGTKYLPGFEYSTPETVWDHYGLTDEQARQGGMNAQMFNSFLDRTKSAIEMAAVANACDLTPPPSGLAFPPVAAGELAQALKPVSEGGLAAHAGTVEVVSSHYPDGSEVDGDLRWGVYVVFEAPDDYVRRCFAEYGLATDDSGRFAAMYKPYHLIGLELGISVASVGLRGEATGAPTGFRGDVVAVAKRPLAAGDRLDGEGGATVNGRLVSAQQSLTEDWLPIGLAHGTQMRAPVDKDQPLRWSDVDIDDSSPAAALRRDLEAEARARAQRGH